MDIDTPLGYREAYRAYGALKRRGLRVLLRDLDGIPPRETAKFEQMKAFGITAEDIAKAAGRDDKQKGK
jgi:DNA-directed RNA polymerase specialized sigma24 family protein